jgi:hypothetical protein
MAYMSRVFQGRLGRQDDKSSYSEPVAGLLGSRRGEPDEQRVLQKSFQFQLQLETEVCSSFPPPPLVTTTFVHVILLVDLFFALTRSLSNGAAMFY